MSLNKKNGEMRHITVVLSFRIQRNILKMASVIYIYENGSIVERTKVKRLHRI